MNERLNKLQYQIIFEFVDCLNQIDTSSILNMLREIENEILKRNYQNSTISLFVKKKLILSTFITFVTS